METGSYHKEKNITDGGN